MTTTTDEQRRAIMDKLIDDAYAIAAPFKAKTPERADHETLLAQKTIIIRIQVTEDPVA